MGATDLELLLEVVWAHGCEAGTTARRPVADFLKDMLSRLSASENQYALAGSIAYGLYARARYTSDVTLILSHSLWDAIDQIAQDLGLVPERSGDAEKRFLHSSTGVHLQVSLGIGGPKRLALENPEWHLIFGKRAPAARPEHLLWLYCSSDEPRDFADAVCLAMECSVDHTTLRQRLYDVDDKAALARIDRVFEAVSRTKGSTYSASVDRRLKRRNRLVGTPMGRVK